MKKSFKVAILMMGMSLGFVLSSILAGCAAQRAKPVPVAQGFINSYDQQIYATLYSTEVAINQARVIFGTDPKAKKTLNAAIAAYNDALTGYLVWRGASIQDPAADHSKLDNTIAVLLGAIAAIEQQLQKTLTWQ